MPELDGFDIDRTVNLTDDGDVEGIMLYADVDFTNPEQVEARAFEWHQVFPGGPVMWDVGIADRLRAAGLIVEEIAGWQERGHGELYPQGVVLHHTAGPPNGRAPSLGTCIYGVSGVPGPLVQVLQTREASGPDHFIVIAAGMAYHAGRGGWDGLSGNQSVWGLEIEHTGLEPLPDHRRELALRYAAANLESLGHTTAYRECQHSEWSYPPGSKIDVATGVNADEWRDLTTAIMRGGAPTPPTPSDEGNEDDIMLLVAMDRDGMFAKKGHLYLIDALGAVDVDPEPASSFHGYSQGIVSMGTLDAIIGDRIKRGIALGTVKS